MSENVFNILVFQNRIYFITFADFHRNLILRTKFLFLHAKPRYTIDTNRHSCEELSQSSSCYAT